MTDNEYMEKLLALYRKQDFYKGAWNAVAPGLELYVAENDVTKEIKDTYFCIKYLGFEVTHFGTIDTDHSFIKPEFFDTVRALIEEKKNTIVLNGKKYKLVEEPKANTSNDDIPF